MTDKPVAKSLHTLTVILQVARYVQMIKPSVSADHAVTRAMIVLGLSGRADPYGLQERALALLTAKKDA